MRKGYIGILLVSIIGGVLLVSVCLTALYSFTDNKLTYFVVDDHKNDGVYIFGIAAILLGGTVLWFNHTFRKKQEAEEE
mgnify:CR=1 FL=1